MALLQIALSGFGGSVGPLFYHAITSASAARRGLYLSAVSGSPHLTFEPRSGSPIELFPGDMWFESGSPDGNMFIAESSSIAGNPILIHRFITTRHNEVTIDQVVARFTGSDAPVDSIIGLNAIVIDNFYVTVNSAAVSGALVRNQTWGGGFFMPNSGTVAVSGSPMDFLVPSGAFTIERGNMTVLSGTLTVLTGSIFLKSVGVSKSEFVISGSNVTASLQGQPIVSVLTGSVATSSLSPTPVEGTMYVNTMTRHIAVRASGTFFDVDVDAPFLVDGGTY